VKYHIPIFHPNTGLRTVVVPQERVTELEEEIFELAKQVPYSPNFCIVVNKPEYIALCEYRKGLSSPTVASGLPQHLHICGFRILPGWCSKPVIVELP
jgi:hypothetical protein